MTNFLKEIVAHLVVRNQEGNGSAMSNTEDESPRSKISGKGSRDAEQNKLNRLAKKALASYRSAFGQGRE